jgi:hypothetical protein
MRLCICSATFREHLMVLMMTGPLYYKRDSEGNMQERALYLLHRSDRLMNRRSLEFVYFQIKLS